LQKYPELIIHYHGHNTDGNDIGRSVEAVRNGAKIVNGGDHSFTGFYGPPPLLTIIDTLEDYGHHAMGIDKKAIIDTSNRLRPEREYYRDFESQFFGFDPTVQIHKLPGGATGSSFEQAVKGGFLNLMPQILQDELPKVQVELGNWWSVTPGSQILWTTAVNNVLKKARYKEVTDDLKNLLLGRYGDFPFYKPADWIYEKIFGKEWLDILKREGGYQKIEDIDIDIERRVLEHRLGRKASENELVLYLQHPNDAVSFFKFQEKYGKTWALPPRIWFHRGGFNLGDRFEFPDANGKLHNVEIGPQRRTAGNDFVTYLIIDHHMEPILTVMEDESTREKAKPIISAKEIAALAKSGDIRSPIKGTVNQVPIGAGTEISAGEVLIVLEAMKMLTNVISEVNGKITEVLVSPGDSIDVGDPLLSISLS
jgi:pyruvate carboxylase